jgi:hypothetical protein
MQHEIKQCNHLPTYYYFITPSPISHDILNLIKPDTNFLNVKQTKWYGQFIHLTLEKTNNMYFVKVNIFILMYFLHIIYIYLRVKCFVSITLDQIEPDKNKYRFKWVRLSWLPRSGSISIKSILGQIYIVLNWEQGDTIARLVE